MNKFISHFFHHLLYLYMKRLFILLLIVLLCIPGFTQIRNDVPRYNPDSVREELDKRPYFSLYKDNYFIVGTTIGSKPTNKNSDVKFQLSISQRLTKSKLPFDTYLFITYTQKAFWNVFQESLPMYDLNFNPGIGLSHLVIHRNRLIGQVSLLIEHESNGKDSIYSRSWNKISFMGALAVDRNVELQFKTWIPIIDSGNNRDILKYCGIFQLAGSYISDNRRFGATVILTKRSGWNFNFNTVIELNARLFPNENQYFFIQYYNGYGEGLLDYNKFHSRLRVGFVIKPQNFSNY